MASDKILRSVVQIGNNPPQEEALTNWGKLLESDLEFNNKEDNSIYEYLREFYASMGNPPDFSLVKDFFEKRDDVAAVSRLDEIKSAPFYIRTNFLSLVRSEKDSQNVRNLVLILRDAAVIAEHGKNLDKAKSGKNRLHGVQDAIGFMFENMGDLTRMESGEKLEGIVSEDAEEVIEEYDQVSKTNKYAGRNLVGLEPVDSVCEGHRSGEYWIHCAFAGELKSTFAINYAYNNAYVYGKNIFYAILEMSYKQLRKQIYALHSSHGKFVTEWFYEDKKRGIPEQECYRGLDYRKIRDGKLDEIGLQRLKLVAQDFKANSKGRIYIWRPEEQATMEQIKRKAEMFHNKFSCDGVIIDYLGLVKPKYRSNDHIVSINNVVSEGRLLALNFSRGKTIPVLGLFQLNRQGKLRAEKNDGRYDFAAISYANQIEKDADVISYTYLNDELRTQGKFYMGCLKNRDNPIFERMIGKIIWQTRRMRAIETGMLDLSNDQVKNALDKITSLTVDDMMMTGTLRRQ